MVWISADGTPSPTTHPLDWILVCCGLLWCLLGISLPLLLVTKTKEVEAQNQLDHSSCHLVEVSHESTHHMCARARGLHTCERCAAVVSSGPRPCRETGQRRVELRTEQLVECSPGPGTQTTDSVDIRVFVALPLSWERFVTCCFKAVGSEDDLFRANPFFYGFRP